MLDLSENKLTTLPDAIPRLKALESLAINNNQLTALPDALGQLPNLRELHYSRNQLDELPPTLEARIRGGQLRVLSSLSSTWLAGEQPAAELATANLLADQFEGVALFSAITSTMRRSLTDPVDYEDYLQTLKQIAVAYPTGRQYGPLPPSLQRLPPLLLAPLRSPDGDTRQHGIVQLVDLLHQLEEAYKWQEQSDYFPLIVPAAVGQLLKALHVNRRMYLVEPAAPHDCPKPAEKSPLLLAGPATTNLAAHSPKVSEQVDSAGQPPPAPDGQKPGWLSKWRSAWGLGSET